MPRPRLTTDYKGQRLGARRLIELLEEHLDRGRPNVEESEDILLIASELTKLAMPATGQRGLINRLRTIDRSRSVLSWDEVEDKLHVLLERTITRYSHTRRPSRRIPAPLRNKLRPASNLPAPRR